MAGTPSNLTEADKQSSAKSKVFRYGRSGVVLQRDENGRLHIA